MIDSSFVFQLDDSNSSYTWLGREHHLLSCQWSFLPISKIEKHGGVFKKLAKVSLTLHQNQFLNKHEIKTYESAEAQSISKLRNVSCEL